jgi:hypothetical protein
MYNHMCILFNLNSLLTSFVLLVAMVTSLSTTRSIFLWRDSGGILCRPPELTPTHIGDIPFGIGDIAIDIGRTVFGVGDTAPGTGDVPLKAGDTSLCEPPTGK